MSVNAHLVVIMDTQYYDGRGHRFEQLHFPVRPLCNQLELIPTLDIVRGILCGLVKLAVKFSSLDGIGFFTSGMLTIQSQTSFR